MSPVFDTSVLIGVTRGKTSAGIALTKHSKEKTYITVINKYEFLRGIASSNISDHKRSQLLDFLSQFTVIEFTDKTTNFCAKVYSKLKAEGLLINELDIIIIGICMESDETIITYDKDFEEAGRLVGVKVDLLRV